MLATPYLNKSPPKSPPDLLWISSEIPREIWEEIWEEINLDKGLQALYIKSKLILSMLNYSSK